MQSSLAMIPAAVGLVCAGAALAHSHQGPLLAIPQQNIEVREVPVPPPAQQQVEPSHPVATSADGAWREAAKEAMKAIVATDRLTADDRQEMAKREKDQSPRSIFLLRLKVLQQLASK